MNDHPGELPDDLSTATATELTAALRERQLSSRELLEFLLARVETHNPALNAVVTSDPDRALADAARADDEVANGELRGPLHGLPMTVKDTWETAGMRTTCGSPTLAEHVPDADALAVSRLRDAGAVIFAKTNTPVWAGDIQTYNEVFGVTNNPWDVTRTPGGSSGGAAAAVAAGITPLELGSDIGGSIRMPSHCCGTFGLKPSWGLVPSRGHIPGPPGSLLETDVNSGGPIARCVEDLGLAFAQIAGPVPELARGWKLQLPLASPRPGVNGLRIAVSFDDDYPVDAEVRDVIASLADRLADAGAVVEETSLPVSLAEGHLSWVRTVLPTIGANLPDDTYALLAGLEGLESSDDVATESGRSIASRYRDWAHADQERQLQRRRWDEHFEHHDVVLAPVLQVPAFPHDNERDLPARSSVIDGRQVSHLDFIAWCGAIGSVLLPVVTVPAGLTGRTHLPVGVQVIGPYLRDLDLLDMAQHISEVAGGFTPPPAPG